ncbi:MAG: SBBP repeat-containing protein [Ignavibacteria bacterium]|nr:SBBP repeat-containing protein [Ignavibacteria bacterium]
MKNSKPVYLLIVIVFLTECSSLYSQVSQQWATSFNSPTNGSDEPVAMTVDNSGNIYVTGVSPTSTTAKDFATVKYNSEGVQQWVARFNSAGPQDEIVKGIAVDASGNVIVTGSVSAGFLLTVKYNSSGTEQWAKQLGVPTASPAAPGNGKSPIAIDAAGNIYVGGARTFGSGQNSSYLLVKYNLNGDSLWTRTYKGSHFLQALGSAIKCIKIDGNSVYVTGKSFDLNPNFTFATTIKYDLSGNQIWLRKDTLINGSDDVIGMETDHSGNLIVTCNYGFDIVTYKYNSSGVRLWKKLYAGIGGNYYDNVTGIAVDPSGNIYLTGNSVRTTGSGGEDFLTLKYDPTGNLMWDRFYNGTYGDSDYSKGISVDAEGNSYITGIAFDLSFDFNYTTIKYDTDGTQNWKISYDGGFTHRRDEPVAIALDLSGNVIVTGISSRGVNTDDFTTVKYSQTTGVNQISSQIPKGYSLSQNYPNPFNPATNLEFGISKLGFVTLKIFDLLGKEIATLVNSELRAGSYKYNFDAGNSPSGVYFYKLTAGEFSETKKMSLIK